jgi:Spy/CpxP family protein refolding chaperone
MGMMQGMGGMRMPGMGGMAMSPMMMAPPGADRILGMSRALELTDAQSQQLRAIADQARTASAPHLQAAMQAHHAAMQALDADPPDVAKYEAQLREAANHFVEAQVAQARSGAQALALLTPAQRANVRFALRLEHDRAMAGMMGAMGGMEGMSGQGMQHDMQGAGPGADAMHGMMHDMQHPAPGKPATPPDTVRH